MRSQAPKKNYSAARLRKLITRIALLGNQVRLFPLKTSPPIRNHQAGRQVVAFDHILRWLEDAGAPPLYALLGEYGMGKTTHCQVLTRHFQEEQRQGKSGPTPLYFDMRKVESVAAAETGVPGHVATLREAIEDCLRNGYLHVDGDVPRYEQVSEIIDAGSLVIFDGLDQVLSHHRQTRPNLHGKPAQGHSGSTRTPACNGSQGRRATSAQGTDKLPNPVFPQSCRTKQSPDRTASWQPNCQAV